MMFLVYETCSPNISDNLVNVDYEEVKGIYNNKELMLKDFPEIDKDRLDYPYEYKEFELNKKYENLLF